MCGPADHQMEKSQVREREKRGRTKRWEIEMKYNVRDLKKKKRIIASLSLLCVFSSSVGPWCEWSPHIYINSDLLILFFFLHYFLLSVWL